MLMSDKYTMIRAISIPITIIALKNVYGQYNLSIKIPYRSITIEKIHNPNPSINQIIQFNDNTWTILNFENLKTYAGNWNANTNTPNLSPVGTPLQFYIVSVDGTTDLAGSLGTNNWNVGDWVIWNTQTNQWIKLTNLNYVSSFNSRKGVITPMANDYTWKQINKINSAIGHINDVETSSKQTNDSLKWNGTAWVSQPEDTNITNNITSTDIQDNSLLINDFSTTANITQNKVQNLVNNIQNLFPLSGGSLSGSLNMNDNNILNVNLINNINLQNLYTTQTTNDIILKTKEPAFLKGNLLSFNNSILTIYNGLGTKREAETTTFTLPVAGSSTDGYLSNTNWSLFNNKLDASVDANILTLNSQFLNINFLNFDNQIFRKSARIINSDYTIINDDFRTLLFVDGGSTITLPSANILTDGFNISIQRYDRNGTTPVQITTTDAIDIDNDGQIINLNNNYNSASFLSTGSSWTITKNNFKENIIAPCPDGYILVPGDITLETSDFCVMQFEAKNISGTPISQASRLPWIFISTENAFNTCASINISELNGTFRLISNQEWMTIARNIERTPSNWSNGAVGNGSLAIGHTESSSSLLSVTDINDPYDQTGNSESSGWNQRRTFNLSNGNVIWDFAGNALESVDWDFNDSSLTIVPSNFYENQDLKELTNLPNGINSNDIQSAFGYTSNQSAGMWRYAGGTGALRGGSLQNNNLTGIYTLIISSSTLASFYLGFRCVYEESSP